jgi:putative Ca2+/H+ antiporter (TMEM165/GDT1 family)
MVGIGALSILLPPAQVVPAFLAIELLSTVHLLPSIWRQVDWRSLRWVIGGSFLAMAVWMLIPDKLDDEVEGGGQRFGVFGTTVVAFFLAEMGDKTQIATVMLAARFDTYLAVVAGTTAGMMLANAPVVWLGERVTRLLPLTVVHRVSALIFAVLAVLAVWSPF